MENDPIRNFYILGYQDAMEGKKTRRVCRMYKLAYVNGRYDATCSKPNRYETIVY